MKGIYDQMKKVKDVMSTDVDFCTPKDNIFEVATKMEQDDVGIIPIIDEGELKGVITDRDLAIRGTAAKKPGSTSVTDVMSQDLVTVTPDMTVEAAAELMSKHQIRRLPVVVNRHLVGIVSLGDLATDPRTDEFASTALSDISED